jgi:hypothetical protein
MTDATTLDAGSYLLVYECAGTGQIAITVRTAARTESIGESCDRYPRPRDTTVDLRTRGDLMVEITPDAEADRQAAYAVRLERR